VFTPTLDDVLEMYPRSLPNPHAAFSGGAGLMATGMVAPEADPVSSVHSAFPSLDVDEMRPAKLPIVHGAYDAGVPGVK
jgi:hypothetical protein